MGKIFISHSSANNAEALAIDDWLHEQGWADTFLDLDPRRGLVAGDRWQAALKSAADSCELILIVISPDWAASRWCLAEFLLAKSLNKQIVGVLVKPTPYETLPPELTAEWQLVDLASGKMGWSTTIVPPRLPNETNIAFSEAGLARLSAGLHKAGLDPSHFPWPPADDPDRPPYRGLLPLDAGDAGIFFGRDGMIVLTLDGLRGLRTKAAPRFATILGASGAGKSSFLRAGLLPRLERDSRHFHVLPVVRPERAALTGQHGLAAALMAALGARNIRINRADVRNAVLAGADAVAPLLRQIVAPVDPGSAPETPPILVLAVDQAEELLEPGDSAIEAAALLTLLADLAGRDDPALMVIFTIRSDGYGRLQDRPELSGTKPHQLIDLSPMPVGSYGDVIRGPARRLATGGRKLDLEEPLVDALLEDIHKGGGKDALPLLAFTLERLYRDYGADGDLKLSEYQQLGRIGGAIEAAVDQALKSADGNPAIPADRAARLALLRRGLIPWLAGIDPDTKSPRRRVARLSEVPDEARPMIQLLVGQRLLSVDRDTHSGETTIEPAHEALLRQWGALDGWLVEDSADLALLEAVRRAAGEWAANNSSTEFLAHKGARLGAAEASAKQEKFANYLTGNDRAYLRAAREAEDRVAHAARIARLRLAIAGAAVAAVLLVGATIGYFVWQAGEAAKRLAEANFYLAQAEAALRAGKPEEGARAALAAYDILPTAATRTDALGAAMSISPKAMGQISSNGRIVDVRWLDPSHVAMLSATGAITAIDVTSLERNVTQLPQGVVGVGLVPDGSGGAMVLAADASIVRPDGTIALAAPEQEFALQAGTLQTSADGKLIVVLGLIGDVLVRDCRTPVCIDTVLEYRDNQRNYAKAGAVKPDGSGFAVAYITNEVAVYSDARRPPVIRQTEESETPDLVGLGWEQATGSLFVLSDRGNLWTFGADGGDALREMSIPAPSRMEVSFATGRIAAGCDHGAICLFDGISIWEQIAGHSSSATIIRWSPDGQFLLSVAPGEPARLWTMNENRGVTFAWPTDGDVALKTVAIDRARDLIAVGGSFGHVQVFDNEGLPVPYLGFDDEAASLAFLTDGRLAAAYQDRGVAFFTLGKAEPDALEDIFASSFSRIAALSGEVRAAVPLTDGNIVTFSGDGLIRSVLDPDSMKLTPWGIVAAPSPNEAFISYSDGTIRRRNLATGAEGVTVYDASQSLCGTEPTTDNNGAKSLDVSDDGKWLVATRTDARVIVHNLADPAKPICIALLAPDSKTVAFSPDSSKLAILSATDRLYVFDLAQPDSAIILGAPAVPDNSPLAVAAGPARTTSWLDWVDDQTLAIATTAGSVEMLRLDPASWRARVDSLAVAQ
ncbi:MAG: TIR domain-containing protein [Devosia sp.]